MRVKFKNTIYEMSKVEFKKQESGYKLMFHEQIDPDYNILSIEAIVYNYSEIDTLLKFGYCDLDIYKDVVMHHYKINN